MGSSREATVPIGWIRPFLRVTTARPEELAGFERAGISLRDLAQPDARVSHRVLMDLLARTIQKSKNPRLGLAAGQLVEPAEIDVLAYAARGCDTLREAIHTANRYMTLMHSALEARLVERSDEALWEIGFVGPVTQVPAANDFILVAACTFARRATGSGGALREVHFQHAEATDAAEYERIFGGAAVKLGMAHNALIFHRSFLDTPILHPSPLLKAAFEVYATELLERLKRGNGVAGRVRELMFAQLSSGELTMPKVARKLGMSVATLRRRLEEEQTSHSDILDEVRRELAEKYLKDMSLAIGEIAFLLGFSHVTAFYKAFRRWFDGKTPAEYRAHLTVSR